MTAIYYWQQSLEKSRQWIAEAKVLETIKQSYSDEIFKKIINLNKKYQDLLVFDIEHFYADKTKENFLFDFQALKENLDKVVLRERREVLQKKLMGAVDEKIKAKILKEIQELNTKI